MNIQLLVNQRSVTLYSRKRFVKYLLKEVFNQIAALQKDMGSIEQILFKVQCVTDSQRCTEPEEGTPVILDYLPEVAMEKVRTIREIVMSREKTINTMLEYYLSVYKSLDDETA